MTFRRQPAGLAERTSGGFARPPNKGMKLTKLRAAPVWPAEVPPCAFRRFAAARTASQLIPGVRPTWRSLAHGLFFIGVVLMATVSSSCTRQLPTTGSLTLASGKTIRILNAGSMGPPSAAHYWFEYGSSTTSTAELRDELEQVWLTIRPEVERVGVSLAFVAASEPELHLRLTAWSPSWTQNEVGCQAYTRTNNSWTAGEVGCCTMRPCLVREGR